MAATAGVVLRERPDDVAPAVPVSLLGIWLDVERVQGEWLKVDFGWVRESEVVRDEQTSILTFTDWPTPLRIKKPGIPGHAPLTLRAVCRAAA